jgi:Tfp pilus assembly protein PilO
MKMRFVSLVAVTLVIAIAWYAAAFKPARSKLSDVRADVKTTQDEVAQLTAKLTELQNLKKNEKELRAEFKKFAQALPVEPAVADFILDVQGAADQAGIDFLSITPSLPSAPQAVAVAPSGTSTAPAESANQTTSSEAEEASAAAAPAPVSPLQTIAVALTADGKFFEVEDFVAKMEKLERAIRIDDFTLSSGKDAGTGLGADDSPGISLSIKLQMFMNRPAAPAATTTAPATGSSTSES